MLLRRHRMAMEINISTIKIFAAFNDVEVQIAAMEYTELRILGLVGRSKRWTGELNVKNKRHGTTASCD